MSGLKGDMRKGVRNQIFYSSYTRMDYAGEIILSALEALKLVTK